MVKSLKLIDLRSHIFRYSIRLYGLIEQREAQRYLPRLLRHRDAAVGAFVVQVCIKVASC